MIHSSTGIQQNIAGKIAIVTGSTSGIGLGIAAVLAEHGCSVVITGSREVDKEFLDKVTKNNTLPVHYCRANLSVRTDIEKLFEFTESTLGVCEILVNNAGVQHVSPLESFAEEQWDRVLELDLSSCFLTTKRALPGMKSRGFGRIVNIASVHGLVASANKAAYVSAKHGLLGLTKVTALECAGTGVTCNSICPGWVLTPLVQQQLEARSAASGRTVEEEAVLLVAEKQPSKQFILSEDVGQLVAFLSGPFAHQITGASIPMDGGWTCQ